MKLIAPVLLLACGLSSALSQEVDYQRDIRDLFATKCAACHGALSQESGLRLDAGSFIHDGGDGGPVLDLDNPTESELIARVSATDLDHRMPPEGQGEALTTQQIDLLTAWIRAGAPFPEGEAIPADPRQHWAYQAPVKGPLPAAGASVGDVHPIDAFIMTKLQVRGLKPLPQAEARTLVRRVYLDLVGLPPTPAQQEAFVRDPSPQAWQELVDRLLDDPAYGERWGRHWMDVWRYSDWDGYKDELRSSQRHIWRWREWIIGSLNADKPYDRMIVEMLAADEVAPTDLDALRATGYLARNFHKSNRNIWLDATVEHTAKAFLGMTIDCARCHDHKFDPLAQTEYYALRAVFEPHEVRMERLPDEADVQKQGLVRAYDAQPQTPTYLYIAGNEKNPGKERPLEPGVPTVIGLEFLPEPVELPPLAIYPALRDYVEQEEMTAAAARIEAADAELAALGGVEDDATREITQQNKLAAVAEFESLSARWAADRQKYANTSDGDESTELAQAAASAERAASFERTRHTALVKQQAVTKAEASEEANEAKKQAAIEKAKNELAEAMNQLGAAEKSVSETNAIDYTPVGTAYPTTSTGRRTALARWITDRRNPLTARVAANHLWLHHFGEPLVVNMFDFGLRSPRPEHAELLDWLAVEFMENGWSMKHLHRLMVTSAAYQRASSTGDEGFAANFKDDPDNELYWRANVQRLDAEIIRDSVLYVAGGLDLTRGGPDIDFEQGEQVPRRSVYFRHAYEKQMLLLTTFDAASPTDCYRRSPSVIPQQALALSNGTLVLEQARRLAAKLTAAHTQNQPFIEQAFVTVLCRTCSPEELVACDEFLQMQAAQLGRSTELTAIASKVEASVPPAADPRQRSRENLIHVLMNHNDFVTVR